tara:strand:- start:11514 stop:11741 length:228 start_codon:yes stop_codon:yes gene_type:complete
MNTRQIFDIGDLVKICHPVNKAGVVLETKLISERTHPHDHAWHPDEYRCKIQYLNSRATTWVRAKMLVHLSKINQ